MSAGRQPAAWSRRKWMVWISLSFAAHVGLIVLLGERPAPPPPAEPPFHAALAEHFAPVAVRRPDYDDPVLFALPSPRGFSGAGWLRAARLPHQYHEWSEAQRWLPLPDAGLGLTFVRHVRLLTERPPALPEKPEPAFAAVAADGSADWLPQRSRMRLEKALAARLAQPPPEPPAWPSKEALQITVIEVAVDERGRVLTAAIAAESGAPPADQQALDLARELTFQPGPPGAGMLLGKVFLEWATYPPPTNAVPATTPAP